MGCHGHWLGGHADHLGDLEHRACQYRRPLSAVARDVARYPGLSYEKSFESETDFDGATGDEEPPMAVDPAMVFECA